MLPTWLTKKTAPLLDSIFRGLSRGLATKTFVEFLAVIFEFDPSVSATLASTLVTAAAMYTSFAGTQWWNLDLEDAETQQAFTQLARSSLFHCTRLADAVFRGAARAEVMMNWLLIAGRTIDYDATVPAGVLGMLTLMTATWTSYNRSSSRLRWQKNFFLSEEKPNTESSHLLSISSSI